MLVGRRKVPVLLAKLYADLLVGSPDRVGDSLPKSIPELMKRYVIEIHRPFKDETPADTVLSDMQVTARECVCRDNRPGAVPTKNLLESLGGVNAEDRLFILNIFPGQDQGSVQLPDPVLEFSLAKPFWRAFTVRPVHLRPRRVEVNDQALDQFNVDQGNCH